VVSDVSLGRRSLIKLILDERIVSPFPPLDRVGNGSIDLSLGNYFLSPRRALSPGIDASKPSESDRIFEEVRVSNSGRFVLHPKQFVLSATREYVSLPFNTAGLLQSRSTYGRMGLFAVAAAWVSPLYKGCPTLELFNGGDVAIELEPGLPVCQLILLGADGDLGSTPSRYHLETRPAFARPEGSPVMHELELWT
jgi:dCTP deaminase